MAINHTLTTLYQQLLEGQPHTALFGHWPLSEKRAEPTLKNKFDPLRIRSHSRHHIQ